MPEAPELTRLVSALGAAQAIVTGADRVSVEQALRELEQAWANCPDDRLDAFDNANIELTRATLRQLLDLDGGECLARALRLARQFGPDQEDQRLLVQVLLAAGNSARQAGDFDAARPLIDQAIERAGRTLGPLDEELANAHNCLGMWGRYRGEFELARQAYRTALRIAELGPHPRMPANILHNLASLEHLAGRPEPALELIETALSLRDDDAAGREADDGVRAVILIDLGRYPESADLFRSLSVRFNERWGAESSELMHLNANWAVLEQQQGDLIAARDRYEKALAAAERLGGPENPDAAVIYANAAHLAQISGDPGTARRYADRALLGLEGRAAADLPSLQLARQVRDALDS